ncbi:MAG: HAD-IC family P-type ATPase [Candidatus Brocadiales bacterium]
MQRKKSVVRPIHIAIKGRARFRIEGLSHSGSLAEHLALRLSNLNGITSVSPNPATGNALIFFDEEDCPYEIALQIEAIVIEYGSNGSATEQDLRSEIRHERAHGKNGSSKMANLPGASMPGRFVNRIKDLVPHAGDQRVEDWHLQEVDIVLASFNTSRLSGLTSRSAKENINKYGPNLLPESEPRSGFSILTGQFTTAPVALLGASAVISIMTGGIIDAVAISCVVVLNAVIGYKTESQAEKTINSLKRLVRPYAHVLRDKELEMISASELAVGDLIALKPGSYVAADCRLVETKRLTADESALTGESMPVLKTPDVLADNGVPLAERSNMIYMGTLVTGGQGLAVVVATGKFTEMGKIQTLCGEARAPETPMERQLGQLGRQLAFLSVAFCGAYLGVGLLRGFGFMPMLGSSTSLAVAAIPEGLPTIAITTLALGIKDMRKHNVLIRKLDAVETLGSIQTICLDKTGTLTMNEMAVVSVYAGMQRMEVCDGRFVNGKGDIDPCKNGELLKMMHVCVLCSETTIDVNERGEYVLNGSATENALVFMTLSAGIDPLELRGSFPEVRKTHRSEDCKYMSTVHTNGNGSRFVALKGSPAEVVAMCDWQIKDGERVLLTEEEKLTIETENEQMAGDALRVLGTAYANGDGDDTSDGDYDGLTWLGLVGMTDPIREGMQDTIAGFHRAGLDTVMITGDQSLTAGAVGKELNLNRGEKLEVLDSSHLSRVEPEVLSALSEKVHVFARVSPAHKFQIVQALQRSGKVVAMTGDGINDGPALKAADIGIAMGNSGTDVAREVADVVLEDDNIETMVVAISRGRTIHNNIRKSVHYLLSTNMSEMFVVFTGVACGFGFTLNAMQLLWINIITDVFPGLALALEPPEPDVIDQQPRDPEEPIIRSSDLKRITFEAGTMTAASLGAYTYGAMRYGVGPAASTMAFGSLVTAQLIHAHSCRSDRHSVFSEEKLPPNRLLNIVITGSLAAQAIVMIHPWSRAFLGLTSFGLIDALVMGGMAVTPFMINEATKDTGGTAAGSNGRAHVVDVPYRPLTDERQRLLGAPEVETEEV